MADQKSSEGKLTTLECMECGYREVFTERQFRFTDGLSCYVCTGPVSPAITKPGEEIRNRRMKKSTELNEKALQRLRQDMRYGVDWASGKDFTVETSFDINGAIKGLKTVQMWVGK